MQQSFEEQFTVDRTKYLTPELWNRLVYEVGLRLRALDRIRIDWEAISQQGIEVLLDRLNEVLLPASERIRNLSELGFLVAPSETPVALAEGPVQFIISEGVARDLFTPSPFLAITRIANSSDLAIARLSAYNNETGALDVVVEAVMGDPGPHSDWQIAAVAGATLAQISFLNEARIARDQSLTNAGNAGDAAEEAVLARNATLTHRNAAEAATKGFVGGYEAGEFPTTRRDGSALVPGDLIYDLTAGMARVWDGSTWAPTIASSISGLRFEQGTFGPSPDGVITVGGGFQRVMVYVNGALLTEGDDYTAVSPTVTILNPTEGEEWFVWGFSALDATDYYTKEEIDAALVALSYSGVRPLSWVSANVNAQAGQRIWCNTASAARIVTLPAAPVSGDTIDVARIGANSVTVARNSKTIAGLAEDLIIDTDMTLATLTYVNGGWRVAARSIA